MTTKNTQPTPSIEWTQSPETPKLIIGTSPLSPGISLFIIEICEDRSDRGRLIGAFVPDNHESSSLFTRGKIEWLKSMASVMMREFIEKHLQDEMATARTEITALHEENTRLNAQKAAWQDGRMEGRREAVSILMRMDPESLDDCIGSQPNGDSGDYSACWIEEKLRAKFDCDAREGAYERLEGHYWTAMGKKTGLEEEIKGLSEDSRLLKGLINLCGSEDSEGRFRVTLDYDNYHDGARVLDGDGKVVGECYDSSPEISDEDSDAMVEWQHKEAIRKALITDH